MLHCGSDLLTNLCKRFLKFKENVPKTGRTANNSILGTVDTICLGTYNLSRNLFDTLINYINRIVATFQNTSQVFYFYMKILHTGTNFEKLEQKRVD